GNRQYREKECDHALSLQGFSLELKWQLVRGYHYQKSCRLLVVIARQRCVDCPSSETHECWKTLRQDTYAGHLPCLPPRSHHWSQSQLRLHHQCGLMPSE